MHDFSTTPVMGGIPDSPAGLFSFPTGDELRAVAALFPAERTTTSGYVFRQDFDVQLSPWNTADYLGGQFIGNVATKTVHYSDERSGNLTRRAHLKGGAIEGTYRGADGSRVAPGAVRETRTFREGIFAELQLSPGVVKFRRTNGAAADRALGRRKDDLRATRLEVSGWIRPLRQEQQLLVDDLESEEHELRLDAQRGTISRWSRKSQNNLRLVISQLDLAPEIQKGMPVLATFTLPKSWLEITPTAAEASAVWNRFGVWWAGFFGEGMKCIWKREFQRRGAPHWHIWTVLPEAPPEWDKGYEAWQSRLHREITSGWLAAMKLKERASDEVPAARVHSVHLSFTEAARARDPRRLSTYFLKESGPSEAKAYQNRSPLAWAGQSVGRFWGVRGIGRIVETVALEPCHAHRVWRVLRKLRQSRRRVDEARPRVPGRAGFVIVNDGAHVGRQLSLVVKAYRFGVRPVGEYAHPRTGELIEVPALPYAPSVNDARERSAARRYALRSEHRAAQRYWDAVTDLERIYEKTGVDRRAVQLV